MLMTEAEQPNEGDTQQPVEQSTDTQQQAEGVQEQQVSDETAVESETSETGAPDQYEFNTKVADAPEELDPDVVTAFGDVAKDLDMPQDAAQKVLDKMAPVIQAKQAKVLEQVRSDWANDSQSDSEFGGEALTANLDIAKTALDTFGTDSLKSLLQETGFGNHPEIIRFMYRAGKAISEDEYVGSSMGANAQGGNVPKDFNGIANALYSNQQNK